MDRAELLRAGPVELSPPPQPDGRRSDTAAQEYVGQALAGDHPRFDWVHRRADGRDVPCEVTLLRLPAAGRRLVRGGLFDLTERREMERAAGTPRTPGRPAARPRPAPPGCGRWCRAERHRLGARPGDAAAPVHQRPRRGAAGVPDRTVAGRRRPGDADPAPRRPGGGAGAGCGGRSPRTRTSRCPTGCRPPTGAGCGCSTSGTSPGTRPATPTALHAVLFDVTESAAAGAGRCAAGRGRPGRWPDRPGERAARRRRRARRRAAGRAGGRVAARRRRAATGRWPPRRPEPARRSAALPPVAAPQTLRRPTAPDGRSSSPTSARPCCARRRPATRSSCRALAAMGARSVLVVPLLTAGERRGAADLRHRRPRTAGRRGRPGPGRRPRSAHGDDGRRRAGGRPAAAAARGDRGAVGGRHGRRGCRRARPPASAGPGCHVVVGLHRSGSTGCCTPVHARGYPAERGPASRRAAVGAASPIAEAARTGRPVWLPDRRPWASAIPQAVAAPAGGDQAPRPPCRCWSATGWSARSPSRFPTPRRFDARRAGVPAHRRRPGRPSPSSGPRWPTSAGRWPRRCSAACCPGGCPRWTRLAVAARYLPAVRGHRRPAATGTTCSRSRTAGSPSPSATWSATAHRPRR